MYETMRQLPESGAPGLACLPFHHIRVESPRSESNRRPPSYQDGALPLSYKGNSAGAPPGTRTPNLPIKSRALCQLSYRRNVVKMEPVAGIEPAFSAWKADALAIEVHRQCLVKWGREESNLRLSHYE